MSHSEKSSDPADVDKPTFYFNSENEDEEAESECASLAESSHLPRSVTPMSRKRKRGKAKNIKLAYTISSHYKEDHGMALYSVQFCHFTREGDPVLFATAGSNRVTVYEAASDGTCKLQRCFADEDKEEFFYCCAWSVDWSSKEPLLVAAGKRGIIRVMSVASMHCSRFYTGHGNAINDLKFHPQDHNLLLSAGKDQSLRLWNLRTDCCVAMFGGAEGHRDEVLYADFHCDGKLFVSCGMDHALKIWSMESPEITQIVEKSYSYTNYKNKRSFPTFTAHFPEFTTSRVHQNYVDCVRWFSDILLSKSCENDIVCWKPGPLSQEGIPSMPDLSADAEVSILHRLEFRKCEIWYMRFSMDPLQKVLVVGNVAGKIYLWDLDVDSFTHIRSSVLQHPKCLYAIRQVDVSSDGNTLISVCEDGSLWRWDRPSQTS